MGLKELNERKGALLAELRALIEGAKNEKRALTAEENEKVETLSAEIENIGRSIQNEERAASLIGEEEKQVDNAGAPEQRAAKDIVADMVRLREIRANENTVSSVGSIVPAEFSKDIIKKVTELSGIMQRISVVNSKGVYKQIVQNDSYKISAGWTDEIAEITASTAKFTTLDIGHHKLAALVKMSLELINQNDFDVVSEFTSQMTLDFALKAETAIIKGTGSGQPYGLTTSGTAYTLTAAALTSDDIVKIYHSLKAPFRPNSAWVMSNDTLCKIRLLKDGQGQYIYHQGEFTDGYVGTILGRPVLISECMDNIADTKVPILFGDYARAYKANINPDMTLQILVEKYAEIGCRGILGILWLDGRPVNPEAYVKVAVDVA